MRLGYIASHYPAISHTFVAREIRALRRQGVHVHTFSIRRSPPEELLTQADRQEAAETFSVLPARPVDLVRAHAEALRRRPVRYVATLGHALRRAVPGLRGLLWGVFYFIEAIPVWQRCEQLGVRHLHAQFADSATDVALLVRRFGGSGWSWSLAVHGPVEFYDVTQNRLAEKVADADAVLAISDFGRSQLMTVAPEKRWDRIHVVRCGIEPKTVAPPECRDGRGRILCVGRLVHLKGQSLLIEGVATLRRRGVDAHLTLVGDGPKRPELEEQAARLGVSGAVTFAGAVGQDSVGAYYASADVFALPSMAEGLPVVFMEALAYELPAVATRIMGIPEIVEDEKSGILITPGRLDELVDALERLLTDSELRARLGKEGRRRVLAEFDVDRSAERLRELFASMPGVAQSVPSADR
jgi:colanic acid/amylovoran biosynthesis glycosyltransferase